MAVYNGTVGNNTITGGADNDLINGLAGNDSLVGGSGNDTIYGDLGLDTMDGGAGNDVLYGGEDGDYLNGNLGNDYMDGGASRDTLIGGAGADTLVGGAGADFMAGLAGADTYYVDNVGDEVYDQAETNVIDTIIASVTYSIPINVENLTLAAGAGNINGFGYSNANTIVGNEGDNLLDGGDGADTISGGLGNDLIKGGAGRDSMTGGDGADVFKIRTIGETTALSTTCDIVTDFVSGTDKIDVSMIDANATMPGYQSFTFIGNAAITEPGQLRFANGLLTGNTGGTTAPEFAIALTGVTSISASDLIVVDTVAPVITTATSLSLAENSGRDQVVGRATIDEGTATYTLSGADANRFTLTASTGYITLNPNPNFENRSSYAVTLRATDPAGNYSEVVLTVNILNLDEIAPTITSPATGPAQDENQNVLYTATADDSLDISAGVTWSLSGTDASLLTIHPTTGVVTKASGNFDHETKASYSFNVIASDGVNPAVTQAVTVALNDLDEAPPDFTSGGTAQAIDENAGGGTVVYTATSTDNGDIVSGPTTYTLKAGVGDDTYFSIDGSTGEVTLLADADHEVKPSYTFTVVATDLAGNASEKVVTLSVNDLDEVAPDFTSSGTAENIDENSGSGQVVYTAESTDTGDISTGSTVYTLKDGVGDEALFTIDEDTGEVTLTEDPDHEAKGSYTFTVVATDAAGNASELPVTLNVNDLDEVAPEFTGGATATATAIDENTGEDTVIFNADATDPAEDGPTGPVTYSLKDVDDDASFSIDEDTGEVTLLESPDADTKPSYSFTVVATDGAGNASEQAVTLEINDLDEVAPEFSSGTTATAIDENTGQNTVIYTAAATDPAEDGPSDPVTYSLGTSGDEASFDIDTDTGEVTLLDMPDADTKASYSFTVIATDAAGNETPRTVTLAINDLDDADPVITSSGTATAIDENSGTGQDVYTAVADDTGDDVSGGVTFSLAVGGDSAKFSIHPTTGVVTLNENPNYEVKSSYSFTVVATDAAGNEDDQAVTLAINDVVELGPEFTSTGTADPIDENSGSNQEVYTVTTTDTATFAIKAGVGDDTSFTIDETTGVVTFTVNPDHETKSSYTFTVEATDGNGTTEHVVTLSINDLDEDAPNFTSGATAAAVDENTGNGDVVYTAAATDPATDTGPSDPVTYTLKAVDDWASFDIDEDTGEVTLMVDPDFESDTSLSFTVIATDDAGNEREQAVTLAINNVNEAPTAVSLTNTTTSGPENTSTATRIKVADISVTDDALGTNALSLTGTDAASFEIDGAELYLKAGVVLDYEAKSSYSITVNVNDASVGGSPDATTDYTLTLTDVNEAANVSLTNTTTSLAEDASTTSRTKVADISITDDALGVNTLSLTGTDAASFEIDGAVLYLKAGVSLDYETKTSYSVTVNVDDAAIGSGVEDSENFTLNITNVNEAPTAVSLTNTITSGPENTDTSTRIKVADIVVTDDALGTNALSLTGTDAASFEIDGTALYLKAGVVLDYEAKSSYSITVNVNDAGVGGSPDATTDYTLTLTNVNEAPTVALTNTTTSLAEDASTTSRTKVADISITDDALGTNSLSLTGTDAASFEIDAGVLYLKAGVSLDYETKTSYSVTVNVDDAALGSGVEDSENFTLNITNVTEPAPVITSVSATATQISFVATGANTITLVAPFATPFGSPTITSAATTNLTPTEQGSVVDGTLQVTNGATADVMNLVLGASTYDSIDKSGLTSAVAIYGFGGADVIYGGSANDTLVGGGNIDQMTGNGGADSFYIGTMASGEMDWVLDFGNGSDSILGTVSSGAELRVYLHTGGVAFSAAASGLTVSGVLRVTGNTGNDSITGGSGADTITGGQGADTIALSAGGSDTLVFSAAASNGVDSISSFLQGATGSGGDVMNFAAINLATALGGTGFAAQTIATGVSASVIALTNDAVGNAAALKTALDARNEWDKTNIGNRIVVWEINTTTVGVALVNNDDTSNNSDVSVTQIATLTGFADQTAVSAFTAGLVAANFVLS